MDLDSNADEEAWGAQEDDWEPGSPIQYSNDTANETAGPFPYLNITTQVRIEYAMPLFGYAFPVLFIITIVANTLVVVVLSKRHMRSPTNAVLMGMALSDMLTVLFPAPWMLYMYTFGNHYKPFSPTVACYCYLWMNEVIPNLFHTASVWLTLALAVQRYIYVCHAATARTWCTMPRVLRGIVWIFVFATLHQSTRFVDSVFLHVEITWEGEVHSACQERIADWVDSVGRNVYFPFYFLFRVIFIHLCPCVSLIVLNILLLRAMREAQRKRQQLFKDNKKGSGECRRLMDSYSTTLMLFVVVTVFLVVEVPLAVLTILHVISSVVEEFLDYEVVNTLILMNNFFIIVSYPINFAIYCGMSRQFRKTFKELFVWGAGSATKDGYGSSRYSLVNGPRTCTNETVL